MAIISVSVDTYDFNYNSDSGSTSSVNACEINCYAAGVFKARICLIKESEDQPLLPANAVHDGAPYLYYPLNQFGDIIGIFRYQKPIGISLDTDTLIGSVYCVQDKPGAQYKK
jgi:hypothetical protein